MLRAAGEQLRVTVAGRDAADLVPIEDAPSWTAGSRARELISSAQADAGLSAELDQAFPDTTDQRISSSVGCRHVGDELARLRVALKATGRAMKAMDAWIAATAMAHRAAVCTQDADFDAAVEADLTEVAQV